ncbi:hypothetical protein [Ensifer canadensis]|uniref:hypothetical protein n=1 Tax=Ensifer canadensis TaxID=555315 RepID=UPI0035E3DB4D
MIGIHKSDQPLLDAAACAARGDQNAVRVAIKQSEALAARSNTQVFANLILAARAFFRSSRKGDAVQGRRATHPADSLG